jgi:ribosomal protein S18 acetylase RimI-like enzyme
MTPSDARPAVAGGPGAVHAGTALEVVPATADRWPDLDTVFTGRGDPGRCWCQWFFTGTEAAAEDVTAANRAAFRAQVKAGPPPGVLAYSGERPVGWCAVGPRCGYGRLPRMAVMRGTDPAGLADPSVWAITCFVVKAGARRQGVAAALLDGAVTLAASQRASVVEAYPVDVSAKSAVSPAELYHGPLSVFARAGFTEVRRPQPARPVVQLRIGGAAG